MVPSTGIGPGFVFFGLRQESLGNQGLRPGGLSLAFRDLGLEMRDCALQGNERLHYTSKQGITYLQPFWRAVRLMVPLKQIDYGVYGDLILICSGFRV